MHSPQSQDGAHRLAAGWMALLGAVTEANGEAWEAASQIGCTQLIHTY
jgi:hypothetical protein